MKMEAKKKKTKQPGLAILVSDKIHFKTKAIRGDQKGHYIILYKSIQQEDITLVNIYALTQEHLNIYRKS